MMKKSLKKKMVIALAGIILAGSMGWSRIPVRAATNGVICSHRTSQTVWTDGGYKCDHWGHMKRKQGATWCTDVCRELIKVTFEYGDYEEHKYTHWVKIEDIGNGLYNFRIWCDDCGYEDEVLSGDPNDPQL